MWDPFDEINKIKREMDKMFEDFFERSERGFSSKKGIKDFSIPLSDVRESKDDIIINLDMPGVDKKDIIITVKDNILEVKAEKKHESRIEKKGMYKYERSYSGFQRTLSLPDNVESDKLKSEYKDGVLKIKIPKAEKKRIKKIGYKKMKKTIFVLILLVLVSGCFLNKTADSTVVCDGKRVSISQGCIPDDGKNYFEEQMNLNCVPAQCCHPTSCVFEKDAPDCKGVMCTMECKPETMDCGQGECKYINGKCEAVYGK